MYLFVYIFLMLSAMGLFTNVYIIQATRLMKDDRVVGEVFGQWHRAIHSFVKEVPSIVGNVSYCNLSWSHHYTGSPAVALAAGPYCTGWVGAAMSPYPKLAGQTRYYLPNDYNFVDYMFISVYYKSAGQSYVLSVVPEDVEDSAGGYSQVSWEGFTVPEILAQLKETNLDPITYGRILDTTCNGVAGRWLLTDVYLGGNRICYPVNNGVAAGGAGIISPL